MTYEESINYIRKTNKYGTKPGLVRMKILMDAFDNPHKKLKYIHIAGTNGKGSTASFISSILINANYKVGIFTSPYIQRFSERIKINNNEIQNKDVAKLISKIKEKIDKIDYFKTDHPTEFEILTTMAFMYYLENNCEIVVLEVGLGGKLDSTNIIENSLVSVITSISYDHMDLLGNTLEDIAKQKCGIIKKNNCVVLYPQKEEVLNIVYNTCKEQNSTLVKLDLNKIKILESNSSFSSFNFCEFENLKILLLGNYQILNACLSIEVIKVLISKGFEISTKNIRDGLFFTKWPGRLEIIKSNPEFIIDGAHNKDGAINLLNNLKHLYKDGKFIFIIGFLKNKEYLEIVDLFIPIAKQFITVTPLNTQALPSKDLETLIKDNLKFNNVKSCENVQQAIELANSTNKNEIICAFGSLYFIGEIRSYFFNNYT